MSVTLDEYDRHVVSHTRPQTGFMDLLSSPPTASRTTTYSTQRQRVLSPGEVANIPAGKALHLDGVQWELLTLTPGQR